MRNFSKKLAFVLAAAMVFTAFAPAAKADAAEKEMTMNRATQTLYVNEGVNDAGSEYLADGLTGNKQEYDFYVANKPANYAKEYDFKWESSKPEVATVDNKGLTKAVAVGTTTITCTITDKAAKVDPVVVTAKVTVKANAAEVYLKEASLDNDDAVVEVGATIDLDREMVDEKGNKTAKRGTYVTDYTRWIAEDADGEDATATGAVVINQSNGVYEFKAAGVYTLYCETYQSDKYNQATASSEKITVTVEDAKVAIEDIEQESIVAFDILFTKAVESLSKTDVTVNKVRLNSKGEPFNSPVRVKDVTLNKEKTVASVTLFSGLTDATDYVVTVAGIEESDKFTASLGKPESIELIAKDKASGAVMDDVLITNQPVVLSHIVRDAENVDVTLANYKVTYSLVERKNALYTLTNGELTIKKPGETAAVKATYQETDKGKVVKEVSETFYFTAKDPDPIYVIGVTDFSLNNFDQNGNKTSLQLQDKDLYLKVKVSTDDPAEKEPTVLGAGDALTKATGKPEIKFVAMNPEICNITSDGKLVPYKSGTAMFYINTVTKVDKKDVEETFDSLYIEIDENSKVSSFEMAKTDAFVGSVSVNDSDKAELKVVTYDQHGNKFGDGKAVTIKCTTEKFESDNAVADGYLTISVNGAEQTITARGENLADKLDAELKDGENFTLDFKAELANMAIEFTVTVQAPTGNADDDEIVVECKDSIDALRYNDGNNNNTNAEDAKNLTFTVYRVNSDVKVGLQEFKPYPAKEEEAVKGTYYYKLTKNGTAVKTDYLDPKGGSSSSVTVALSETTKTVSGSVVDTIVKYGDTATGTYVFELYLSENDKEVSWIAEAICDVTVGNKGEYTIVSQEKDEVTIANDYAMTDNEVSTDAAAKKAIVECFKFNKNGKEFKFDFTADETPATLYDVKYDATKDTGSVYVESITVYENVGDAYVDYVIPVNAVLVRK